MHNSVLNVLLIERSSCDARTICELLSVAKAVEFRVEWVERLSAGLEWLASDFQRKKPQRKVQFQIAEGMNVEGDPELLQVVLENLIGNAWKFTSKRPTARIEFGAKQINGVDTYFLRDDGVGFDPAFASKLFSPFERLHREREYDGNGIGLATVQRVVMRHGGHVWAESQPNDGAIFFFTLCGTPSSSDYLDDSDRGSG